MTYWKEIADDLRAGLVTIWDTLDQLEVVGQETGAEALAALMKTACEAQGVEPVLWWLEQLADFIEAKLARQG